MRYRILPVTDFSGQSRILLDLFLCPLFLLWFIASKLAICKLCTLLKQKLQLFIFILKYINNNNHYNNNNKITTSPVASKKKRKKKSIIHMGRLYIS